MELVCEKCGSTNTVPDQDAAPGAEGIPCENCGEMIPVPGEKAGAASPQAGPQAEGSGEGSEDAPQGENEPRDQESPKFSTQTLRKATPRSKSEPSVEDSGIVDVVKLLSAARAAQSASSKTEGDDSALLGVKRPAIGPLSIAPEDEDKEEGGGKTVYAILGAGALIGMALLATAWILKPQLQPIAGLAPSPGQQATETAGSEQPEPEMQQAEVEESAPPSSGSEQAEAKEEESKEGRSRNEERTPRRATSSKAQEQGSGKADEPRAENKDRAEPEPEGEGEPAAETAQPAEADPAGATAAAKSAADDRSMENLLDDAVVGKPLETGQGTQPSAAPAAGPARNLPKKPSRDQVLDTLRRVQSKVSACAGGKKGMAMAAIKVASDGRVKSVKVSNIEEPAASCIEGAVKQAKFPEFSDPEFSVDFPFRL